MHHATGLFSLVFVAALVTGALAADARKGETLAKRWCAACHVVAADQQVGTTQSTHIFKHGPQVGFHRGNASRYFCSTHIPECRT